MGCDFETLEEYNKPVLVDKREELFIQRQLISAEIRAIDAYYKQLYSRNWLGKYVRFTLLNGITDEKRAMLNRIYLVEKSYSHDYAFSRGKVFARLQLMRKDGLPYSKPKRLQRSYSISILEVFTLEELKALCHE